MFIPARIASGNRPRKPLWAVGGAAALACAYALVGSALAGSGVAFAAAAQPAASNTALLTPASLQAGDAPAGVTSPAGAPVSEIRNRIDGPTGLVISGARLHAALLRQFYAAHNFEPVWPTHQAQADALLKAVMRAEDNGLDPNLFHAALLRNPGTLTQIDREMLLSDAFLSYGDALARGIVPIEIRMDDEDLTPEPVDVAATLNTAINSPDPAAVIEALAPNSPAYVAMRQALRNDRQNVAEAMPPRAAAPDGRLHPVRPPAGEAATEAHIRALMVNLERQRWLPRNIPADRIWVNIANAQLVLYRENRPAFTTRVVVGELDKQTPELQSTITSLLYNPPWNIPYSIATKEILPRLGADPDYLSRHHMRRRSNGAIQQIPGPGSALGQLKFEMTNRFDVYLHDTPLKNLFSRDNRQQSHGCVRVQNPRELAALLMDQSVEAINKGIAAGSTSRRMLPTSIPVFIVYQTAFLDGDGTIQFRPDVYQRDDEIWQHLHPTQIAPVAQHEPNGQRGS